MPLMGSLSTSGTEIRAPLLGVRSHNAFGQLTVMGRGAGSQRLRVPVGAVGWLGCCAAAVPRSSACAVALPRPRQVLHAAHARVALHAAVVLPLTSWRWWDGQRKRKACLSVWLRFRARKPPFACARGSEDAVSLPRARWGKETKS
jgi:hypothetical protein